MTLLDRYIFREFFKNLLLVLSSLVAIYLLVDFFERVDNFTEKGKSIGLILQYFIFKIPFIYDQMSPVCILLAGIITIGLLNRNRELMSLNAGGISIVRITLPVFAASFLFTMATLVVAQWILPWTNTVTNDIWYRQVSNKISKGIERNGRIFYQGETGIYSFLRPKSDQYQFADFSYAAWDENHDMETFLTAKRAIWSEQGWQFEKGQIKTAHQDGGYDITIFMDREVDLPDSAADFFVPAYRTKEFSLYELHKNALSSLKKGDRQGLIEVNQRFSFIFLGVPLLILAIPVLIFLNRRWQRDLAMAVPVSCALAFAAWGVWSGAQSMSQAAYFNPFAASWSIHAVLTGSGIFWLWQMNRS